MNLNITQYSRASIGSKVLFIAMKCNPRLIAKSLMKHERQSRGKADAL